MSTVSLALLLVSFLQALAVFAFFARCVRKDASGRQYVTYLATGFGAVFSFATVQGWIPHLLGLLISSGVLVALLFHRELSKFLVATQALQCFLFLLIAFVGVGNQLLQP